MTLRANGNRALRHLIHQVMGFTTLTILIVPAGCARSPVPQPPTQGPEARTGQERQPPQIAQVIRNWKEFSYELRLEGVPGLIRVDPDSSGWLSSTPIAIIVGLAFTDRKSGPLILTLFPKGETRGISVYSIGVPEAVYAILRLVQPPDRNSWLDRLVPESLRLTTLSREEAHQLILNEGKAQLEEGLNLASIFAAARQKYDQQRASIIRRLSVSFLLYPPSAEMSWVASAKESNLLVRAACFDRQQVAHFWFEFKKDGVDWKYNRTLGSEFWKGE